MLFWIVFCLACLPIRICFPTKVVGKKNLPKKQGYVLTCNHYSNMDPVLIDACFGKKIRFMAKKELFKNKFIAWFLKKMGGFPVDRQKMDMSTFKFALNTLKEKKILGIFPEGTRNKTESESLQDVKSGAVVFAGKGDVPIVPAIIYRKTKFLRRNYILIGEQLNLVAENPKKMTQEEIEFNTQKLSDAMNKLREDFDKKKNEKRKK